MKMNQIAYLKMRSNPVEYYAGRHLLGCGDMRITEINVLL